MKKRTLLPVLVAAIFAVSCSKKVPEIANSIPDNAFMVATFHPKQIVEKGQISSFESITSKIKNEMLLNIVKDPVLSGIDIDEYFYVFSFLVDEGPVVGATAVIKDGKKFEDMIKELLDEDELIESTDGFSFLTKDDDDAAMAWNEKQLIFLATPEENISGEEWKTRIVALFDLPREESVTSLVDFTDFSGKMEDINIWISGDDIMKIMEKAGGMKGLEFDLPVKLYNNYGQYFMKFEDGAMYVHTESHLSDDVEKAAETFLVAKEELNSDLLEMAPGNDLLMAMAFSLDIDRLVKLMKNFSPPQMDSISGKIEKTTGIPGKDILDAMNGDFVVAVNGAPTGSAIPVEILIGIGLDDETLQEKMMGTAGKWTDIQKEGDFFMINANGMEIYSGIVNGVWVITNVAGYKTAITGKGLETTLSESEFKEYAGGSMGMYMNLDLTTYPAALQAMLAMRGSPDMISMITESLESFGMEGSNKEGDIELITANPDENSLYTLLKMMDRAAKSKDN